MNDKCTYEFVKHDNITNQDGSASGKYVCSQCKGQFRDDFFETLIKVGAKHCPYCGAKIKAYDKRA